MSSSVCHAPLPARMEAFTTRICLRAVDQYERLLQSHFNKKKNGNKDQGSTSLPAGKDQQHQQSQQQQQHARPKDAVKSASSSPAVTYSAVVRQRKRSSKGASAGALGGPGPAQRSVSVDSTPDVLADSSKLRAKLEGAEGLAELQRIEQFPCSTALPDAATPEESQALKNLAIKALDLTEPASDVQLKNRLKSWFQLSGHPDGIAPAGPGTVWKRRSADAENNERMVYQALGADKALKDWIPRFHREVEYRGGAFMELQDLLFGFDEPHVVDVKLGTRTFLESEVSKTAERPDLYAKMIGVDPEAPSAEERARGAVTKLRYMQFRERNSSTCSHGFRIEAMKLPGGPPITDLKKVRSHEQVVGTMRLFLSGSRATRDKLLAKLGELRERIEESEYFRTHEVIGSSIFMIFDKTKVGVWLIDFAKTCEVPKGCRLTHRRQWEQGNHEDGFLFGLDKLISVLEEIEL